MERGDTMRNRLSWSGICLVACLSATPAHGQRIMEKLGRGLVAVKTDSGYFLSWRLFGTEQGTDIAFNVYKGTTKLNATPIATSNQLSGRQRRRRGLHRESRGRRHRAVGAAKAMLVLENDYLEIPLKEAPARQSILPMSAIWTGMANTSSSWTGFKTPHPSLSMHTIETARSCGGWTWARTPPIRTCHYPVRLP